MTEPEPVDYELVAREWLARLRRTRGEFPPWYFAMKVGEEGGEVLGAWLALHNYHRHPGTVEQLAAELADVVICAFGVALAEGLDLPGAVAAKHHTLMTRNPGPRLRAGSEYEPGG